MAKKNASAAKGAESKETGASAPAPTAAPAAESQAAPKASKAAASERVVMVSGEQAAREQLAREMAEMAANPLTVTQPGGVYRVGGRLVDANGQPVKGASKSESEDE